MSAPAAQNSQNQPIISQQSDDIEEVSATNPEPSSGSSKHHVMGNKAISFRKLVQLKVHFPKGLEPESGSPNDVDEFPEKSTGQFWNPYAREVNPKNSDTNYFCYGELENIPGACEACGANDNPRPCCRRGWCCIL